jgi:hypothetical protein
MTLKSTLRSVTGLGLAACLLHFTPSARAQGSLTPPPGAPAPTMKTLDQIEPRIPIGPDTTPGDDDQLPSLYKITAPGSYYLTGPITGVSNKCGIEIVASDVTLDLGGFTLSGATGTRMGIFVASGTARITIRNGTICNWVNQDGIQGFGNEIVLSSLNLSSNGINGVHLAGACVVTDCTAVGHTGDRGFKVGDRSVLTRVTARQGGYGIEAGPNSVLTECVASFNSSTGIKTSSGATLTRCIANGNGTGFETYGIVRGCLAQNNTGNGFSGYGLFDQCAAWGNGLNGFSVFESTVLNSEAASSGQHGINLTGSGSRLVGNRCVGNGLSITNGAGIYLAGGGSAPGRHEIANNLCQNNDHGMAVPSSHNRITDNHLADNRVYGLNVTGEYNLIIRNTARNVAAGAINWNIAPLNRAGAYVAPANNAAISGATGGNGSGTTDPFANLSF